MNMTKKKKRQITIIMALLSFALMIALTGCGRNASAKEHAGTISGSFIFDVHDMNALVGDADYVFIGRVLEKGNTHYAPEEGLPETRYKIQVLKNIKGELSTDLEIPINKEGGYVESEDFTYLYEDDYLPKQGDACIFFAYANKGDDALGVSGPNSTILLKSVPAKTLVDSSTLQTEDQNAQEAAYQKCEEYQEVVEALDTQFEPRTRERYHSKYEQQ